MFCLFHFSTNFVGSFVLKVLNMVASVFFAVKCLPMQDHARDGLSVVISPSVASFHKCLGRVWDHGYPLRGAVRGPCVAVLKTPR
jgi:hypothetical protein